MQNHCRNITHLSVALLLIALILRADIIVGQDESEKKIVTQQVWFDFNSSYDLSKRWGFDAKAGTKIIFPYSWYKIYLTGEFAYNIPKFIFKKLHYDEEVYFGVDAFYVINTEDEDIIEISPYQGYGIKWPNRKRLIIQHDLELGQKFQWGVKNLDYSFGLDLSYEGKITWKFHGDVWQYGRGFYLTCAFKFWWNLISTTVFNDVARITPGIGYQINPKWKTAFLMGWNYTRNLTSENFSANNVIYRFRVYYKIPNKILNN